MKHITLLELISYGDDFFDKYDYVARQLGEGAKVEDILKVMDILSKYK